MLKTLFFISNALSFVGAYASPLKSDEHVMFLPSIAYVKDNQLHVEVNVWVYEKESRPGFNTVLSSYLKIDRASLPKNQLAYFEQQTALFKVDSERNKVFTVQFENGTKKPLIATDRAGRSNNTFTFDIAEAQHLIKDNRIHFTIENDERAKGYALYSQDKGYLVISDIDDTIKDSSVLDTKTLLRNTFLHEPKIAKGMPELFKQFQQDLESPLFTYVSSSPIQLLPTLDQFIAKNYPQGFIKLRQSTAWNQVLASKEESMAHKKSSITQLLDAYPNKTLILLGDSGENDPEIYLDIVQNYSDRVEAIYIRNVTNEAKDSQRYQAFPQSKLTIISP
ncbi:phosphatidate phosphatase App1 family protein [Wohlfahrtiimonas populi]|uniref:phosphatidate phosphatase App1 family protein n=1 Tax=Wohlfahrtiimonas populi TaxID=1940240 RepID=UPI001E31A026|nr:phosphatase domain-containing protein [Wohlfahrtiimonas populi]